MNSRLVGHIPKVIEFKGRTQNIHIVDSIVAKIRAVMGEKATDQVTSSEPTVGIAMTQQQLSTIIDSLYSATASFNAR
jgi:hypothetical protein